MKSRALSLIILSLATASLAAYRAQAACSTTISIPAPPASIPTFAFPLEDWTPWLAAVDSMGPSKDKGGAVYPAPPNPEVLPKKVYAALGCGTTGANSTYCYSCPSLAPSALPGVTDDQRKNVLKYYLARYALDTPSKLDPLFANPSGGGAACDSTKAAAGSGAPNANIINAYAARVRHKLNLDVGAFTCLASSAKILTELLSNEAMAYSLQSQLYMLDYMFPDAALWEIVLITCVAKPPVTKPPSPPGSCNGIYL